MVATVPTVMKTTKRYSTQIFSWFWHSEAARWSWRPWRTIGFGLLLCTMGVQQVRAATFVVTNVNDSGTGSLRQAILSANASVNVPDIINFSIDGSGPFKDEHRGERRRE